MPPLDGLISRFRANLALGGGLIAACLQRLHAVQELPPRGFGGASTHPPSVLHGLCVRRCNATKQSSSQQREQKRAAEENELPISLQLLRIRGCVEIAKCVRLSSDAERADKRRMGRSTPSSNATMASRLDQSEQTVSELASRLGEAERAISSLISQVASLEEQLKAARLQEAGREGPVRQLKDVLGALLSGLERCLVCTPGSSPTTGPLRLIISGAPASGKGTQCERIIEQYGVVHLSTGDMLRAAVKSRAPLGVQAEQYMQAGQLVPDHLIISIIVARLQESDCVARGWMLDGFPRSAVQAEALREAGFQPSHAIQLVVPDDILIQRVINRRLDPMTGKIYNIKDRPPESEEVAARVVQRPDDTEEVARKRLATYYSNLAALEAACAPPNPKSVPSRTSVLVVYCPCLMPATALTL